MIKIYEDDNNDLLTKVFNAYDLSKEKIDELYNLNLDLPINEAKCLIEAKKRILIAKENNEKVLIVGDYDCDGIMSTTIMKSLIDKLNIESGYYIPNRFKDGYGLNTDIVSLAKTKGYSLIITVDNGVKAYDALSYAKEVGIDVLVTDHHLMGELPINNIVVHPCYMSDFFNSLCGAGVALEIYRMFFNSDRLIVLAAIATVADMVELWGYNRLLVKKGIKLLKQNDYPTIKLLASKEINNETDLSFDLIPKINSVGRLKEYNANNLVKYFMLEDKYNDYEIKKVALKIIEANLLRKDLVTRMNELASNMVKDEDFIICYSDEFNEGLCGLVANKLSLEYKKPALVLALTNGVYKGSARGVEGFDLHDFLNKYNEYYKNFGGHKGACGLTIEPSKLIKFLEEVRSSKINIEKVPKLVIKTTFDQLTIDNINKLDVLRPFGAGLNLPLFYLEDFIVSKYTLIKDKYPKWYFKSIKDIEAISFEKRNDIANPNFITFNTEISTYRNQRKLNLLVKNVG